MKTSETASPAATQTDEEIAREGIAQYNAAMDALMDEWLAAKVWSDEELSIDKKIAFIHRKIATLRERLAAITKAKTSLPSSGLIKLSHQHEQLIKEWAADSPHGDLWGNDEARSINLTTFARSILGCLPSSGVAEKWTVRRINERLFCLVHKGKDVGETGPWVFTNERMVYSLADHFNAAIAQVEQAFTEEVKGHLSAVKKVRELEARAEAAERKLKESQTGFLGGHINRPEIL